jgi:carbamoyl-phosphate synthase small subunit
MDRVEMRLALEIGAVFHGRGFGACAGTVTVSGEVVFNTAMTGYQEALTDPSYAGQILVMTAPLIGNYGVAGADVESERIQVSGFVIRELARRHSNHRAEGDLGSWLARSGVPGLEGVDTRALVRLLRTSGVMRGSLTCDGQLDDAQLVQMARDSRPMEGHDLASDVTPRQPGQLGEDAPDRLRVVAIDCGGKRSIYRHLIDRGCVVEVMPLDVTADEIRRLHPDGLFVSNGPGDPAAVQGTVRTLARVAGELPTFGICLGHQLLALALGATTYKLKFGHRGANQPVRNLLTGAVEITSQNHGFAVDERSLASVDCQITHLHLNDGTVAGFRHRSRPIFAVQHHPEASPGPHDAAYLFDCFVEMMRTRAPVTAEQMRAAQARTRAAVQSTPLA